QAFLTREPLCHLDRLRIVHGDDLVDVVGAQNVWNEPRADALGFMRRRLSTREHGALRWLDRDHAKARLPGLNVFVHTGESAAGSDAGDQDVDLAIGVVPDFGPGGFTMNLWIRRVGELLRHPTVRSRAQYFLGFGNGPLHALGSGRQDDLGAECAQHNATFHAHGVRHDQDEPVSAHCRHECQADPGVTAGRLDDHGLAGLNPALAFGFVDHADADAVLHAVARIKPFEFRDHRGVAAHRDFVQVNQWSATDQFGDITRDLHICPLY